MPMQLRCIKAVQDKYSQAAINADTLLHAHLRCNITQHFCNIMHHCDTPDCFLFAKVRLAEMAPKRCAMNSQIMCCCLNRSKASPPSSASFQKKKRCPSESAGEKSSQALSPFFVQSAPLLDYQPEGEKPRAQW